MPTKQQEERTHFQKRFNWNWIGFWRMKKKKRKKDRKKGQFHECHMLAQLIHNETMIRKVFR